MRRRPCSRRRTARLARASACAALAAAAITGAVATAQDGAVLDDAAAEGPSREWPRWFERGGRRMCLFQPQVDRWHDFRTMSARAAVAVFPQGADEPEYGAIRFTAPTAVDVATRSVGIGRRTFAGARFPDTDPDRYLEVRDVVEEMLAGTQRIVMSLDEVIAYLDLDDQPVPDVEVDLEPPVIRWLDRPAIVLTFDGEPRFETVSGTGLMVAVNADWDVLLDLGPQRYYLLWHDAWITTSDLDGGLWSAANVLPEGLSRLPPSPDWDDVRVHVPGRTASRAPLVLAGDEPFELIVTNGPPRLEPVEGTSLEAVSNAENDLFRDPGDGHFYLLAGGRWFRATSLEGPWSDATRDLPGAFAAIPRDGPHADVLASVPGTPQAEAAVLLAAVPETATVRRDELTLEVAYSGAPNFVPIEGADGVASAVNTNDEVFRVEGFYYCCHDGVWFGADAPEGPWVVADTIPRQIYTIPWTDPHHRVTYVQVYDSNEETVTVGQTAGYTGELIAMGVVIAGLGYAISQADSVSFNLRVNAGPITIRGRHRTGQKYDEAWGGYRPRGGAYGPYAGSRARSRATGATAASPYARLGDAVVDDRSWARGGAAARPGGRPGGLGDDVYAGFDGNVFRRGSNGSWQQRSGGGWSKLDNGMAQDRTARLDRQAKARSFGLERANRFGGGRGGAGGGSRGGGRRR